jgi:hypothetical protein
MKVVTQGLSIALLLGLGFSAHAQKHVHGEGELLIAQEGNVLFRLPMHWGLNTKLLTHLIKMPLKYSLSN